MDFSFRVSSTSPSALSSVTFQPPASLHDTFRYVVFGPQPGSYASHEVQNSGGIGISHIHIWPSARTGFSFSRTAV